MIIESLDHLVLTVRDLEATIAFYEALGMVHVEFGDGRHALTFGPEQRPVSKINLHEAGAEIEPHAETPVPGSADLCFLVDVDPTQVLFDLESAVIEVEDGPVERTGAHGTLTSLYVRDPDGNLVELSTYR